MNDSPLPIVRDTTGLSIGYRIYWWIKYCALYILGPADRAVEASPRERMKWERAVKVVQAHRSRGTLPDGETVQAAQRM